MNLRLVMRLARFLMLLQFFGSSVQAGQTSNIRADEEVLFFPAWASRSADDRGWDVTLRGSVFEPEQRMLTMGVICAALGTRLENLTTNEWAMLKERSRLFMIDHQRRKQIIVRIGDQTFPLVKTAGNGQFQSSVFLSNEQLQSLNVSGGKAPQFVGVALVLSRNDTRQFTGKVFLHPSTGLTVISDIDDTVKISNVTNRAALLRSTFLEPFQPVPGMATLFSSWHLRGADFAYISASPWQLLPPLTALLQSSGLPEGPFLLKNFRWRDSSLLALFQDPEDYKKSAITPILKRYPKRKFILVGDSGERDPEAFGSLARAFPDQIVQIAIRNVTNESADAPRYKVAFRDLSPENWTVFSDPFVIKDIVLNRITAVLGQGTVAPISGTTSHTPPSPGP